jgi:type IV secretion system protein VirB9
MNKLLLLGALAATASAASAEDNRIATRYYNPSDIVTISARSGTQSTIQFEEGERIENIALGNSATWQVTPNKRASLLFVKPMTGAERTNMTVVTDRRTYLFDLSAHAGNAPLYLLKFSYPKPIVPITVAAKPDPALLAKAKAEAEAERPSPDQLNFAWATRGSKTLLPERLFDDGRSTWLAWPAEVAMPAILQRDPSGKEGPVNYVVQGAYVVVEGVPPLLVLREGKQVATLMPTGRSTRPVAGPPPLPGAQPASSTVPATAPVATPPQTASIAR